jgi:TrmH family RNA methyltransferase
LAITAKDIKFIRSLQRKKHRKAHGVFVVEGVKPVQELIQSTVPVEAIYSTAEFDGIPNDAVSISEKELERISSFKSPNTVLAIAKIPTDAVVNWNQPIILLLDGINDPGNLGTIIRTSKWFGVESVLCSEDCVDAFDRKVVQSTMGALFHSTVIYDDPLQHIETAKTHGYSIIGADMNGQSVYKQKTNQKTLLVIGSEANGFRDEVKERIETFVSIENFESDRKIESLNAAVATAVILSELKRQTAL